ncbi:MAG TPA: UDP-N-acetylglucosamine--N-acetylmuramyl-(pentapeptide) pyrophosphoryl-undecaprenol N-acetylglucosamine transferase [Dehalococcoidia bacterium]|nr:UDP-N-acetylglucosamine--N-acetylmuramyl-(pentapeptide) pyrophosphoryl-undecaprenol N-acetylglucosamine transferase [Dehalococcoidia bacterium]
MRVVLTGGGTGGHVYPALAVAEALAQELAEKEELVLYYVGTGRQVEAEAVSRARIPLLAVRAAPVRGRTPWGMAWGATDLLLGAWQARGLLRRLRPQAILATGGYGSIPVALAARSSGIPLVVFLPDVEPGWAVRIMARLAWRIAATSDLSFPHLPRAKAVATGYPVRSAFLQTGREEGRRRLGLDGPSPILFVGGASQGAHSINRAVAAGLADLLEVCQVVHVAGRRDEAWLRELREGLLPELQERYQLHGYLHDEIAWAMAAADLAVLRAGASTLGEVPAVGVPAVLVPYPHAGAHQLRNAAPLTEAGAGIILEDERLAGLLPLVKGLLEDNAKLEAMRRSARALARPEAARSIARLLIEAARRGP